MTDKRPPAIGVTCGTVGPDEEYRPPRQGQNQTYIQALIRAGAAPLLIPHLPDGPLLRLIYGLIDGLLLPGGEDVDPARYGESLHPRCGSISPERDESELALARRAVEDGKPLLAICRGIQVLNVALGGSLYQDIGSQVPEARRHDWHPGHPRDKLAHTVAIAAGTRLAEIAGAGTLPVNSLHHQSIKDVAPGLTVTASAPDSIVEAVEVEGHPFGLGVQWHPEELARSDARAQGLFDALVEASRR